MEAIDLTNCLRRAAAWLLVWALLAAVPALAEDTMDLTLMRGEHWTVPAERQGDCGISDESVVTFENGELIGLRPGRAEVRFAGSLPTVYRVLVLYAQAEQTQDAAPAAAGTGADYRYYAVSDTDDEGEETADEGPEDEPEEDGMTEDVPADSESPAEDEPQTEGSPEPDSPLEPVSPAEQEEAAADEGSEAQDITIQQYDRSAVPDEIDTVIDFALNEWKVADNKTFSRKGSQNKYSYWQCGKGAKCDIGWCGAFLGYVFDTCGIPMDEPNKSVPHEGGVPYSVRAAGVGKINKGFDRMGRLSMVPRPGYLVVYGEQKAYGYKHIGLVTDVDDLGGGVYLLKTVEGNMSNRIKRYCYLFDSNEPIKNTKPCPEEYRRTDGEINEYEHIKKWNITTFCQTWL